MIDAVLRWVLVGLSVACAVSYRYAVRSLFRSHGRWRRGAISILVVAILAGITQSVLLALVPLEPVTAWSAFALFVVSLATFWSAAAAIRERPLTIVFSDDVPEHLVERGPYRFVRNPFYASYLLCYLAGAVGTRSWALAAAFVVLLAAFTTAARHEERKFLASPLAAEYRRYLRRAGRFTPRLWARS